MLAKMKSTAYADEIRRRINDNRVLETRLYHPNNDDDEESSSGSGGTSHMSVLAPDGAAVSVTSTVGSLCVFTLANSDSMN